MRVLKYVESACSLKCVVTLLYLQMFYVAAFIDVKLGVGDYQRVDSTVLRAGATPREWTGEGGEYQGPLEFDSAGEGRGSPSPRDSGGGEDVPTTTSPYLHSSAAALHGGDTSTATATAPPSTAPLLTGGQLSHER